jgi:purine-binding chemotaxis protein CheW
MNEPTAAVAADTFLLSTFLLGNAAFGIAADRVQEVVRRGAVTIVHHAPRYVVGIRNLRGRIVTVIDLAQRLELGQVEPDPENRILIIDFEGEPIGLLVNRVTDIIDVPATNIEAPPANVHGVSAENLRGVCRSTTRLVAILEIDSLLKVALG